MLIRPFNSLASPCERNEIAVLYSYNRTLEFFSSQKAAMAFCPKKLLSPGGDHPVFVPAESETLSAIVDPQNNKICGAVVLRYLKFESEIFARRMGFLCVFLKEANPPITEKLDSIFLAIISNARDHGYEHLAIKARVEHIPIIMAAENCGFRTVSATTTYLYIKNITKPPKWKYLFKIRTAVPTDKSALMRIASESFSHTRYYNDPFFSKDKCGMLYRKWVENCFDKDWSSNVLVATNSNKDPVGFITYKVDPELENATGVRRGGTGLSACLPHAKGAYLALMAHLMNDVPAKEIPFGEYTTQLENIEVIRAWQHFGLEPGKNEIALHLTL